MFGLLGDLGCLLDFTGHCRGRTRQGSPARSFQPSEICTVHLRAFGSQDGGLQRIELDLPFSLPTCGKFPDEMLPQRGEYRPKVEASSLVDGWEALGAADQDIREQFAEVSPPTESCGDSGPARVG